MSRSVELIGSGRKSGAGRKKKTGPDCSGPVGPNSTVDCCDYFFFAAAFFFAGAFFLVAFFID
jgi:hypothetical protein